MKEIEFLEKYQKNILDLENVEEFLADAANFSRVAEKLKGLKYHELYAILSNSFEYIEAVLFLQRCSSRVFEVPSAAYAHERYHRLLPNSSDVSLKVLGTCIICHCSLDQDEYKQDMEEEFTRRVNELHRNAQLSNNNVTNSDIDLIKAECNLESNPVHTQCQGLHIFHEECIRRWLQVEDCCPLKDPWRDDHLPADTQQVVSLATELELALSSIVGLNVLRVTGWRSIVGLFYFLYDSLRFGIRAAVIHESVFISYIRPHIWDVLIFLTILRLLQR